MTKNVTVSVLASGLLLILAMTPSSWGNISEVKDLSGVYKCQGPNYAGMVGLCRDGETYHLVWSIQGVTHRGVGLLHGNLLSASPSTS